MENEKTITEGYAPEQDRRLSIHAAPLDATPKTRWERSWPTIACGAGLFSDGYLNGVCLLQPCTTWNALLTYFSVIGSVNTMLKILYKDEYSNSSAQSNVTSIAFAGTVVGQLAYVSWSPETLCRSIARLILCFPLTNSEKLQFWLSIRPLVSTTFSTHFDHHPDRLRRSRCRLLWRGG